jgi:hypothetical protein
MSSERVSANAPVIEPGDEYLSQQLAVDAVQQSFPITQYMTCVCVADATTGAEQ